MPELPTCLCVRGLPPYDRLTAIYQAAAELSGDGDLPDPVCVAGVPPFQRFSYIYEAFRELSGSGSLPSQTCVAGESPQDQVSRIYQAVAIYADDSSLLSYECVRGMPMWQQWIEIYRALYLAAGSPDTLVNPACVTIANLDVLIDVFCSLTMQGTATLLASFYIPDIVDAFERAIAAGYTGDGDPDPFQREAAVDVLRDEHYQSGLSPSGSFVILEDEPTECVLVAPQNVEVTPGDGVFDASWDDVPVTANRASFEYQVPGEIGWTNNGTSTSLSMIAIAPGTYTLQVRAISTSGVDGEIGESAPFNIEADILTPDEVAGLMLWLEADSGVEKVGGGAAGNNDGVGLWTDMSGEGNNSDFWVAGTEPIYKTDGAFPSIRFDGIDNFLRLPSFTGLSQITAVVFFNPTSIASPQHILIQWEVSGNGQNMIHYWINGSANVGCFFADSTNTTIQAEQPGSGATGWQLGAAVFDSTPSFYKNDVSGTPVASNGTLRGSTSRMGIGSKIDSIGVPVDPVYFGGDITGILLYDNAVSEADLSGLYAYFQDKYGPF